MIRFAHVGLLLLVASLSHGMTLSLEDTTKNFSIAELLENPIVLPPVRGIAVSDEPLEIHNKEGIHVFLSPSLDCAKLSTSLQPFLGKPITQDRLDRIKQTVIDAYKRASLPIVDVYFPEQNLSQGYIQIIAVQGKLGEYELRGQKYSSEKKLKKMVDIEPGCTIDFHRLATGLAWWNRNPFRYTDAVLCPGSLSGTTNIELITDDTVPLRPYSGADNTGNKETGYPRLFAGIQVGSIFGFDQVITYQYTASTDWDRFWAHTGSYQLPVAKQHQLLFFGGYSKVKGRLSPTVFENDGRLTQVSARYQFFFSPIYGPFLQELDIGYDFKRMNTGLFFGDLTLSKTTPEINQFMIGYYLDYKSSRYLLSFNAEIFASPVQITKDQSNTDFEMLRPFARNKYIYGRTRLSYTQFLPKDFSLACVAMVQLANQNLLPSEEIGLGGYATVRGYAEREVNGDSGTMLSCEFRLPPLTPIRTWTRKKMKDELLFYGFLDYGLAHIRHAIAGEKTNIWLLGVGPGMRYSLATNVSLRAEYGVALHKTGVASDPFGRWHVGGVVSY